MKLTIPSLFLSTCLFLGLSRPAVCLADDFPSVLGIRDRVATVNQITRLRLERLLPTVMHDEGFDMWIIVCNEDNLDPVFKTMVPYDRWFPITQILVFYDDGSEKIERLNLSRTVMDELFVSAWDFQAWDNEKKESQWDCLARIVKERDPRRIGINESENIWAADGLSAALKRRLAATLGETYVSRFESAEKMCIRWLETLLDEELELYHQAHAISHALIAETFSNAVVTPGVTTLDDLSYHYWQRATDLGLRLNAAPPAFYIGARSPESIERYGKDDRVIRRGDFIRCDVGIIYLRYYTDTSEWAYVLRPGETEAPPTFKKIMAAGNRLQDVYCSAFEVGLSGNQILNNALEEAKAREIPNPKIYSHSLGYFLHEPGPLIGLPWEQVDTGARGEVRLVPNSTFVAELSVTSRVPEWNDRELRFALEEAVAFTPAGVYFLDGRQTEFHLIR
jgi:Xaa-Pro aminopeptidase